MKRFTLLAVIVLSVTVAAGEKILFEETFDHYIVKAPGFSKDCKTQEWPPSQKFMAFSPQKRSRMFTSNLRIPKGEQGWRNYELTFRFRFVGDSKKHFDIQLFTESSGKPVKRRTLNVTYAEKYRLGASGLKSFIANRGKLPEEFLKNSNNN